MAINSNDEEIREHRDLNHLIMDISVTWISQGMTIIIAFPVENIEG